MGFISLFISLLIAGLCWIWGAPDAVNYSVWLVGSLITVFLAVCDAT